MLDNLPDLVDEFYSNDFIAENQLIGRKNAFAWIHAPHDEEKLKTLKIESLLKNKDVISTILSRKASTLEDKSQRQWLCF